MHKVFSAMLILVMAVSILIVIGPVQAEVPKPSVPEFTLKLASYPYDVAPTTYTDPYTGKTTITNYGYHSENISVVLTIKNQPFISTLDASGNYTSLYYNVRFKGHFVDDWKYYPEGRNYGYINASQSDYTVLSFSLGGAQLGDVSNGGELDFQVEALIGHDNQISWGVLLYPDFYYYVFAGESSGWSNTQTITLGEGTGATTNPTPFSTSTPIPTGTVPPTLNPTATPAQSDTQAGFLFGLDWEKAAIVVLVVAVVFLAVGMIVLWRRVTVKS
jgi:hypothetical protein